jgi:hypothetical protein
MYFEVTHDFSDRHGSIFFGLEVTASVYVTEGKAEVEHWDVEGVRMPLSALPDGLYDFFLELAIEEWEAGE